MKKALDELRRENRRLRKENRILNGCLVAIAVTVLLIAVVVL